MVDISRKRCKRNGVEIMVDNDGMLWLKKKTCRRRIRS